MARPQAYDPQDGYRYQILCRNPAYGKVYDHCDYAKDRSERDHLLSNYRSAYGGGWQFRVILLPRKYWPKPEPKQHVATAWDRLAEVAESQALEECTR